MPRHASAVKARKRSRDTGVQKYRSRLAAVFRRQLAARDGYSEPRLKKAEERLGFALPEAVREFYSIAGAAKEARVHNMLFPPEGLEVEEGHLVFMQENQGVVDWGIPRGFLKKPDPPVWQ